MFCMQVRLQRPTVSAEMSLMLAIAKFFVPGFTLGGVTPTAFHTSDMLLTGMPRPAWLLVCMRAHVEGLQGIAHLFACLHTAEDTKLTPQDSTSCHVLVQVD